MMLHFKMVICLIAREYVRCTVTCRQTRPGLVLLAWKIGDRFTITRDGPTDWWTNQPTDWDEKTDNKRQTMKSRRAMTNKQSSAEWQWQRKWETKKNLSKKNKAVYTAALVADGWAGAENLEKELCDQPTDQRTDRKVGYRVACPRLKKKRGD